MKRKGKKDGADRLSSFFLFIAQTRELGKISRRGRAIEEKEKKRKEKGGGRKGLRFMRGIRIVTSTTRSQRDVGRKGRRGGGRERTCTIVPYPSYLHLDRGGRREGGGELGGRIKGRERERGRGKKGAAALGHICLRRSWKKGKEGEKDLKKGDSGEGKGEKEKIKDFYLLPPPLRRRKEEERRLLFQLLSHLVIFCSNRSTRRWKKGRGIKKKGNKGEEGEKEGGGEKGRRVEDHLTNLLSMG